jgi:CRISPR-associated protein Cas1
MLKRTLYFSNPYHLSVSNEQLIITEKESRVEKQAHIEDLGFVILEHPHITFSQAAMEKLAEHNVAVVFCNGRYLPTSMLFHLDTNQTQTEKFRAQVAASEPLKKNLWQQTIKQKILNQSSMLELVGKEGAALRYMAGQVKSGDPDNLEGRAAKRYWNSLFGNEFSRDRFGDHPNNLLNYGYTILRAATARALCGSGLLPTLGIHHRNKYNAYCLADDIMEPYRPFVDRIVWNMTINSEPIEELTREQKAALIQVTITDVEIGKKTRPLMVALQETTSSLAKSFLGEQRKLTYPDLT